jgi:hypothetical protein
VPGLQRVLAEDSDDSVIGAAALALAHHGARDAVPAMREALARSASVGSTDEIVGSIHLLGGYPHAEIVAGLEAYFNACPNEEAQRELDDKARDQNPGAGVWTGRYFAKSLPDQPALRDAIRQRAAAVAEPQAQLAANLRVLVERTGNAVVWQGASLATRSLTGVADEPAACPVLAAKADLHPKFSISDRAFRYPWQVRAGDGEVHSGSFGGVNGLWPTEEAM